MKTPKWAIQINDLITERKAFLSFVSHASALTCIDIFKGMEHRFSVSDIIRCGLLTDKKPEDTEMITDEIIYVFHVWMDYEIKTVLQEAM